MRTGKGLMVGHGELVGVSEQALYRWRSECGGLKLDQARRLKGPKALRARPLRIPSGKEFLITP